MCHVRYRRDATETIKTPHSISATNLIQTKRSKMRNLVLILLLGKAFGVIACEPRFPEFLKKFESSQEFQVEETQYPLDITYLDMMVEPEPSQVGDTIQKQQMQCRPTPIFPIGTDGLTKVVKSDQSTFIVTLSKLDTGILLFYTFKQVDGCWKLARFDDKST